MDGKEAITQIAEQIKKFGGKDMEDMDKAFKALLTRIDVLEKCIEQLKFERDYAIEELKIVKEGGKNGK